MKNKRQKILFVQVPSGGGSLIALYEMLRRIDTTIIEPVVLCYHRNEYSTKFENLPKVCVHYFYSNDEEKIIRTTLIKKYPKIVGYAAAQIYSLKKYFIEDRLFIRKLLMFIENIAPDIVYNNNDVFINRDVIRAALKADILQILHTRSLTSYRYNFVDYLLNFFLIRKVDWRIYITEAVKNHYEKLFYLSKKNSFVLHDFVNTDYFRPANVNQTFRKELGIEEDEFVITNIGRIIAWKGQHVLIEAVSLIKHITQKFTVLIVGPYEQGVGSQDYYNYLRELIVRYELQKKVLFTGNRDDVASIINTSNLIVHTATKPEPQGLVIIEALLCKKPVIASNNGGSAEIIKKYGGELVEPSNASALAKLLLKFMGKENYMQYPLNYKKLLKDFKGDKQMKNISDVFQDFKKMKSNQDF
jgi:glycosyltransferase involved in cell wall biosynthesis